MSQFVSPQHWRSHSVSVDARSPSEFSVELRNCKPAYYLRFLHGSEPGLQVQVPGS